MEHTPVLVREVMDLLALPGIRLLVDATVGAGGHARAFLERQPEAEVIGFDRDGEILDVARRNLQGFGPRVRLRRASFSELPAALSEEGVREADAFLFDLGVSSPQLDLAERGFGFRQEGPLDMRMDRTQRTTAADLVQRLSERELADLLFELGGERCARRVAAAIVAERRREPIRTTRRLAEIVRRAVRGRSRIDKATRTFQALRMAVNDEPAELRAGLRAARDALRDGGRIVVIAFHSGEDRIVKEFFRQAGGLVTLTRKPVECSAEEARRNPRARSAKLRAAERRRDVA
jgi:16S rRNA (cytosine1402-N4)-methyltransferase